MEQGGRAQGTARTNPIFILASARRADRLWLRHTILCNSSRYHIFSVRGGAGMVVLRVSDHQYGPRHRRYRSYSFGDGAIVQSHAHRPPFSRCPAAALQAALRLTLNWLGTGQWFNNSQEAEVSRMVVKNESAAASATRRSAAASRFRADL